MQEVQNTSFEIEVESDSVGKANPGLLFVFEPNQVNSRFCNYILKIAYAEVNHAG